MKFRRLKLYNIIFGAAMFLLLPLTVLAQITTTGPDEESILPPTYFMGGGGDDPTQDTFIYLGGTGDDPKAAMNQVQNWDQSVIAAESPHGPNTLFFKGFSPEMAELLVLSWKANTILHDLETTPAKHSDYKLV